MDAGGATVKRFSSMRKRERKTAGRARLVDKNRTILSFYLKHFMSKKYMHKVLGKDYIQ